MCPREFTRPEGMMPDEVFDRVSEELIQHNTKIVNFCGYGEPLIHRALPFYVSRLASRGITTVLRTNGSLLTGERSRALLDAGISVINISAHGISKKTYESIMVGLKFDVLLHHIDELRNANAGGSSKVIINAVALPQNRHEIPRMAAYWKSRGVGHFELNPCHSRGGDLVDVAVYPANAPTAWEGACPIFPLVTYVTWDGNVLACCQDTIGGSTRLGNLRQVGLASVLEAKESKCSEPSMFRICEQCDRRVNYDWLLKA